MSSIRLEKLRKEFGDVVAVDDLDLEIGDGQVRGPARPVRVWQDDDDEHDRRTGDTHLGLFTLTSRLMNDVPPGKRGVGFVFQNYAIFTHMSVYENIGFGLKVRGCPEDEQRREVGKWPSCCSLPICST